MDSDDRNFDALLKYSCSRKDDRKSKKKLKTLCKVAFASHKKIELAIQDEFAEKSKKSSKKKQRKKRKSHGKRKSGTKVKLAEALKSLPPPSHRPDDEDVTEELKRFQREAEEARKDRMLDQLDRDEELIARLEHKLGYSGKRDRGNEPEDELDVLMDMCDSSSKKFNWADKKEKEESEPSTDEDEDMENGEDEEDGEPENDSGEDEPEEEGSESKSEMASALQFDQSLLELARRAKMDSVTKRNVFCIIMSSKNESEAYTRLRQLILKGQEEREIIHISISCSLMEAKYNPYYAILIDKFCSLHKRFKMTTQFALMDKLKSMEKPKSHQRVNLAVLAADLIKMEAVELWVLKAFDFSSATGRSALHTLFNHLFLKSTDSHLKEIFVKATKSSKERSLIDSLKKLLGSMDLDDLAAGNSKEEAATLKRRLAIARSVLDDKR